MSDSLEDYVNKIFRKLGFGEVGVNVVDDNYFFEVQGQRFIYEGSAIAGGGDGVFPEYEGVGMLSVTTSVIEWPNLSDISPRDMLEWLTNPPMFGSVFLQSSASGGVELAAKQETVLSGELDSDLLGVLSVLDNLFGVAKNRQE